MFRRSLMEKLGGYGKDYKYGLDFDIQWRFSQISRFETLPEILVKYRQGHPESISVSRRARQIAAGRHIAIRNLLEIMCNVPTFTVDDAGQFYDALFGKVVNWKTGDVHRLDSLWKKLLGAKGWRMVWGSRLIGLANKLVIWNTGEAKKICRILALQAPLVSPTSLVAASLRTSLSEKNRQKMQRIIGMIKKVSSLSRT